MYRKQSFSFFFSPRPSERTRKKKAKATARLGDRPWTAAKTRQRDARTHARTHARTYARTHARGLLARFQSLVLLVLLSRPTRASRRRRGRERAFSASAADRSRRLGSPEAPAIKIETDRVAAHPRTRGISLFTAIKEERKRIGENASANAVGNFRIASGPRCVTILSRAG